jgi:branched-subunit amino acid ABC-type transport system permease component
VVTLVLMLALTLFLKRTRVGMQMRAAAEDFR